MRARVVAWPGPRPVPGAAQYAVVALLFAACGRQADRAARPIRVFAASSLTTAFEAMATAFERAHPGLAVELHFAGSPTLAMQIREGETADVFAAADEPNMRRVVEAGRTAGPAAEFARNRLAIVVAAGNPRGVRSLADLARADLRVALCGPEVPAGRHARQALRQAGVACASVSDEQNVKALVAKVRLGEVDAAIAFATDVAGSVEAIAIPAEHNVLAGYPVAVLAGGGNRAGGDAFVAFLRGESGRALLRQHGFLLP